MAACGVMSCQVCFSPPSQPGHLGSTSQLAAVTDNGDVRIVDLHHPSQALRSPHMGCTASAHALPCPPLPATWTHASPAASAAVLQGVTSECSKSRSGGSGGLDGRGSSGARSNHGSDGRDGSVLVKTCFRGRVLPEVRGRGEVSAREGEGEGEGEGVRDGAARRAVRQGVCLWRFVAGQESDEGGGRDSYCDDQGSMREKEWERESEYEAAGLELEVEGGESMRSGEAGEEEEGDGRRRSRRLMEAERRREGDRERERNKRASVQCESGEEAGEGGGQASDGPLSAIVVDVWRRGKRGTRRRGEGETLGREMFDGRLGWQRWWQCEYLGGGASGSSGNKLLVANCRHVGMMDLRGGGGGGRVGDNEGVSA